MKIKGFLFSCLFACLGQMAFAQTKIDSSIIDAQRKKVDGRYYTAIVKNDQSVSILNGKGHSALHITAEGDLPNWTNGFEWVDFNHDGCKDVLVDYLTNVPAIYDLFLYDKRHKWFAKVQGFSSYPDPRSIPGTNLYYSYHRSGCADSNWDSDLFKIINFKTVKLGNIHGVGCGEEADVNKGVGIFIYKVNRTKTRLVKQSPIDTIEAYKNNKWDYIARYWKRHYHLFDK